MNPSDAWPTRDQETLVRDIPAAPPGAPPPYPSEEPDGPLGRGMLLALVVIAIAVVGALAGWLITQRGGNTRTTTVISTTTPRSGVAGAAVQKVAVPQLVGLTRQAAVIRLGQAGLRPKIQVRVLGRKDGLVVEQRPVQPQKVVLGSSVLILLDPSPKPAATTHPNPKPAPKAATTTVKTTTTTTAQATTPTPTATTTPAQQTTTSAAQTSQASTTPAPANATVPDVGGKPEADAVAALSQAGLRASIVFVPSSDNLDTVEAQSKPAGTTLPARSHVQLNLSGGNGKFPPETVPSVIGKNVHDAVSTLNGAQLRLLYQKVPVASSAQDGKVVEQSPIAGDKAPQHAQVVVYVGMSQH